MGIGTTYANRVLDYIMRAVEPAAIGSILAGLHSADPGNTGANEIPGVAHQTVNFNAAAAKVSTLAANVPFANMPASWVMYIGYYDDAGNFIAGAPNGQRKDFTAAASTDALTSNAHGFSDGMAVALLPRTGGSLPGGLVEDTPYYVRDAAANTLKLALTSGGVAIDISADGIGTIRRVHRMDAGDTFTLLAGTTYGLDV